MLGLGCMVRSKASPNSLNLFEYKFVHEVCNLTLPELNRFVTIELVAMETLHLIFGDDTGLWEEKIKCTFLQDTANQSYALH